MAAKIYHVAVISLVLGSLSGALAATEPVLPQGFPEERYRRVWQKSPFTVASVIAPEAVNNTTFADGLSLVGLLTIGGKPLVTVVANDSQETQLIDGDKPNAAGLQVVSFVNNLDPTKVEVVLKKGDATGTLHFAINETPAAAPPEPNGDPQTPRRIVQPRPNTVQMPVPNPVQQRVIPRTNGPVAPVQNGNQIIRRRQLQLPGANRQNTPNRPNGNAIPPPK